MLYRHKNIAFWRFVIVLASIAVAVICKKLFPSADIGVFALVGLASLATMSLLVWIIFIVIIKLSDKGKRE